MNIFLNFQEVFFTVYHILTLTKTSERVDFGDFWSDYLGEYEAICETAIAHESGPYVGLIDEKKPRVENLVQLSL
jgi:hypothetical protein